MNALAQPTGVTVRSGARKLAGAEMARARKEMCRLEGLRIRALCDGNIYGQEYDDEMKELSRLLAEKKSQLPQDLVDEALRLRWIAAFIQWPIDPGPAGRTRGVWVMHGLTAEGRELLAALRADVTDPSGFRAVLHKLASSDVAMYGEPMLVASHAKPIVGARSHS